MPWSKARLFLLGVLALGAGPFASACSSSSPVAPSDGGEQGSPGTGLCPSDVPATCPTPEPSYQNDVVPILKRDCLTCHGPNGIAGYDESTYTAVFNQRAPILDQVSACLMPQSGSPQLTTAERVALLGWLVCGAPNN
jgi:hypothetical protein